MNSCRILLVDDSESVLIVLKEFLVLNGHHVTTARSAEDALEIASKGGIGCIISDYHMPGMDGLQLLRTLRASGSDVSFFLMTGTPPEELAAAKTRHDIDGFIAKPVDFSEMLRLISSMDRPRAAHGQRPPAENASAGTRHFP